MEPCEVVAHAALVVADPEAEMRRELKNMIEEIVEQKLRAMLLDTSVTYNMVYMQQAQIKQIAKQAIREHFTNPQYIP